MLSYFFILNGCTVIRIYASNSVGYLDGNKRLQVWILT